jgi:hypothetical protein
LGKIQGHALLVEEGFHVGIIIGRFFGGKIALGRNPLPEWGIILFHMSEKLQRIRFENYTGECSSWQP